MDGTIVYALLKKKIESAATGIVDIYKEDGYIVFVMKDGTEFRIEDSTKDIIDVDIDNERYIVVTYEDQTTTKSDSPIPYPDVMEGATTSKAGKEGLVPKPTKGGIRYLNSQGNWDETPNTRLDSVEEQVVMLSSVVPVAGIPDGATLTADGWAVTTDSEVEDEFAKWMEG